MNHTDPQLYQHAIPLNVEHAHESASHEAPSRFPANKPLFLFLISGTLFVPVALLFLMNHKAGTYPAILSPLAEDTVSGISSPVTSRLSPYSPTDYIVRARNLLDEAGMIADHIPMSEEDTRDIAMTISKSIETITEGLTLYPNESSLWATRGDIFLSLTRTSPRALSQAQSDYTQAHNIAPQNTQYSLTLAHLYLHNQTSIKDQGLNALEVLWQTHTYVPTDSRILQELARLQTELGYIAQARDSYISLLALPGTSQERTTILLEKNTLDKLITQADGIIPRHNEDDIKLNRTIYFDTVANIQPAFNPYEFISDGKVLVASDFTLSSPYEETFTSSAVSATSLIPAGQKSVIVKNIHVTDRSPVYVAPLGDEIVVLSVTEKRAGNSFTVVLDATVKRDVQFRYWITTD